MPVPEDRLWEALDEIGHAVRASQRVTALEAEIPGFMQLIDEKLDRIGDRLEDLKSRKGEDHAAFAKRLGDHEGRLGDLEKWKAKMVGAVVAASSFGGILGGIVINIVTKGSA